MAKREYWNCKRLKDTGASWLFAIGGRNLGKSYSIKEEVLKTAYNEKSHIVYLRRWGKDVKQSSVESYFFDAPIKKITKGEYDTIIAYHGYLYWGYFDEETNKAIKGNELGRYCALNESARYKSQVFTNVSDIIYEEMIPDDNMYLDNDEPTRLQNFVSTCLRSESGRVWLIGNTLSRVSPYAKSYCIDFLRMKQGQIDIYNYKVDGGIVKLAIEYCAKQSYENTMFFGKASKQIANGEWEVNDVNKLPKPLEQYDKVYDMLIEYQNFRFILLLLVDGETGGRICYIYPYTREFDAYKGFRVLTDRFSTNPFISARLDVSRVPERYIQECFALNKLCYSDNLTGADFKNVNDYFHISNMFES